MAGEIQPFFLLINFLAFQIHMPIVIENLNKSYKKNNAKSVQILFDLNLTIEDGESFGFLGPNGAGKSTVIKILMNFIRANSGEIRINGKSNISPSTRYNIGYLPEQPLFYDHLTAYEILRFGGRLSDVPEDVLNERIDSLLERLLLTHAKNKPIRTYSKGMTQRVGLALAMIHNPDICILDEPMSGLDPMGRKLVTDFIMDMRREGKTVFFSSHILSDVNKLCDRVGILNRGNLLFCGPIEELKNVEGDIESSFVKIVENDNRNRK
jgi:ABC-2 type transport system ATP-binding protein